MVWIWLQGMCLSTIISFLHSNHLPLHKQTMWTARVHLHSSWVCALYIFAVGTGGTKPNISTIGADQVNDFEPKERIHKLSFCNWWMFSVFLGTLFGNTVIVYIQDNVGWTLGYGLPTLGLLISLMIFASGQVGLPFIGTKCPLGVHLQGCQEGGPSKWPWSFMSWT